MKTRKQSGCVVFRYGTGKHAYEVLLISSSNGKKWAFPKGGIEPDLSAKESALKETYEEAGVTGHIVKRLGEYEYRKAGRDQHVVMYAMLYVKDTADWPEKKLRVRKWVSINKARKLLPDNLVPFLDELEARDHVATASDSGDLEYIHSHLITLPVLQKHGADIKLDKDRITIKLDGLTLKIFEDLRHFMLKRMTVEYETESGEQHFTHATVQTLAGVVGRICGRYISKHAH